MHRIIGALERQLEVVDHKVEALAEMQGDLHAKLERVTARRVELENAIAEEQAGKK